MAVVLGYQNEIEVTISNRKVNVKDLNHHSARNTQLR
jgi:hypothetical protein